MPGRDTGASPRIAGRYALYGRLGAGGMATVYVGKLRGPVGFARLVAIKRLHDHLACEQEFIKRFADEARLASRIHHPNVVSTLDVVSADGELLLVLEYVHGESLGRILREAKAPVPLPIASAIVIGVLHGLHAAHESSEAGRPLGIVHRDVSPHNILIGVDGIARVLDFGIAKAAGRLHTTNDGAVRGRVAYMAPEQLRGKPVSRQTDIYSASIVLWELVTGRRLFEGDEGTVVEQVLLGQIDPPSRYLPSLSEELERIILRGLSADPARRFESARAMALALEEHVPPALPSKVGAWVADSAPDSLRRRTELVAEVEVEVEVEHAASTQATIAATVTPNAEKRGPMPRAALAIGASVLLLGSMVAFGSRAFSPASPSSNAPTPSPELPRGPAPSAATRPANASPPPTESTPPAPAVTSKPKPRARAKSSKPSCDPPYVIAPSGLKTYKLECL